MSGETTEYQMMIDLNFFGYELEALQNMTNEQIRGLYKMEFGKE